MMIDGKVIQLDNKLGERFTYVKSLHSNKLTSMNVRILLESSNGFRSIDVLKGLSTLKISEFQQHCLRNLRLTKSRFNHSLHAMITPWFLVRELGEYRFEIVKELPKDIFIA
jgi:hypothetical protein